MPGSLQYGDGIKALAVNFLVAQMPPFRRGVELVQAMSGIKLSEATCLAYIQRSHDALELWEVAVKEHLLTRLPFIPMRPASGSTRKTSGCM